MIYRVLSLFLLLQLQLFGAQYNSTIIELEAKLFPKMLMLSEDLDKNASSLEIVIVAQECALYSAKLFKESIEKTYSQNLVSKKILVNIVEFENLSGKPDGIIVLYHPDKELHAIAKWANTQKIPSFSYDPAHLEFGILGSLYFGVQTKPYLNKEVLKKYNFTFNPYLLELSKFY